VLTPTYGTTPVAYIPGIGTIAGVHDGAGNLIPDAIPVLWWYPICSMPFGVIASRIIGTLPIEP
jgi:hypothetical protein